MLTNETVEAIKLLQGQGYDIVRREAKIKLAGQVMNPRNMWDREEGLRAHTRKHTAHLLAKELLERGDVLRQEAIYTDADQKHPYFGSDLVIHRTTFEFYHPQGVEFRR